MKILKSLALAAFALCAMCASAQNEQVTIQGDHSDLDAVIQLPAGLKKASEKVPMVILCHAFTGTKEGEMFDQIAYSQFILMDGATSCFPGRRSKWPIMWPSSSCQSSATMMVESDETHPYGRDVINTSAL